MGASCAELGWPGIAVAEEHGGQGLGAVELAVLLEELGYACAATPFLSTAVGRGGDPGRAAPTSSARAGCPALASGEATAGVGTRELCADGAGAAVLVLLDGDEARAASTGADGRAARRRSTRRAATRAVSRRQRRAARRRAPPTACAPRVAAEVVGVCQRALDMTLDYVKDRKQFGVPVGSFQAVAHRCAQMLLRHRERALDGVLRGLGGGRRPGAAARGGGAGRAPRRPTAGAR